MFKIKESDLNNIQVNISKYCLLNVKAFFIISYMYISVVNLISSTAISEATLDEQGDNSFDITSLPHHNQRTVSSIDDSVLWNCRETSLTKNYYKVLYSMLLIVSVLATLIFFGVKTLNFCGDTPLKRLWEVAVAQQLQETLQNVKDRSQKKPKKLSHAIKLYLIRICLILRKISLAVMGIFELLHRSYQRFI